MRGRTRWLLAWILMVSAAIPFVILGIESVADQWRWPALVPDDLNGDAWSSVVAAGARLHTALLYSCGLAMATALLATSIALPVGRAIADLQGWRRHVGAALVFLPVAAPPIALATGLQLTFLTVGLAGTFHGVLVAHLIPAVGYLSLFFLGIFSVWDARAEDEARTLGATPLQVILQVTLPMLRPSLAAAAALAFLISWAQVPLTLLIGRGHVPTLPLEVFAYVQAGQTRYAAVGALLLAVPPLLALGAARLATRDVDVVPA